MKMRLIVNSILHAKRAAALVAGIAFITASLTCSCVGDLSHAQGKEQSPKTASHHHDSDSPSGHSQEHGDDHACTCPDITAQLSTQVDIVKLQQNPESLQGLAFTGLDMGLVCPENSIYDHGPPERSPPLFFFSPSFASRAPPALV